MRKIGFCFFVIILFLGVTANGEIYKWKDKNGVVSFGNKPPKDAENITVHSTDEDIKAEIPEKILVSISKDFSIVRSEIASSWAPYTNKLSSTQLWGITSEPKYEGKKPKYGILSLGTFDNKSYYYVFDEIDKSNIVLYFDRNQNGDFTDDGGPIKNEGTGTFAAAINLPIRQIIKQLDIPGDFYIWFFINDDNWKQGYSCHYSQTQFKGNVKIKDKTYLAYISETNRNDADFTNDGIYIDINNDGKIEEKTEYFKPDAIVLINGAKYLFEIGW
ncbi:MAG: DUF4124 domain-containing protein [Desulfobacterales bacterium]|nr:DUF4124 domain-containing protein [Desulfobacterales bacterium]